MEKKIVLLFLLGCLLGESKKTVACDACGAAVNTVSTGILPNFFKHYIGLYTAQSRFYSNLPAGGGGMSDRFNSLELRARLQLAKRWQLFASLPLNRIDHRLNQLVYNYTALGDVALWGAYTIGQHKKDTATKGQHLLQVGGGVKWPTGKYTYLASDYSWTPGAQAGTGSVDGLLIAQYTVRKKQVGLQANVSARLNTSNPLHYRFGSRLSSGIIAFYQKQQKQFIGLPSMGLFVENAGTDIHLNEAIIGTKTNTLWLQGGLDFYWRNIGIGARWQYPCWQHDEGPQRLSRFNANVYINF